MDMDLMYETVEIINLKNLINEKTFFYKLYSEFNATKQNIIAVSINKKSLVSSKKIIGLSENGKFLGEWPDGFFDERFIEKGLL